MIALRARRTAHQVASAVYLHQHTRALLKTCKICRRDFVPDEASQTRCPICSKWPAFALHAGSQIASDWANDDATPSGINRLADILGLIAAFGVIITFVCFVLSSMKH